MRKTPAPKWEVERVARMYDTNKEAARALGVTPLTFVRLCKEYDIETPWERRRKRAAAQRELTENRREEDEFKHETTFQRPIK